MSAIAPRARGSRLAAVPRRLLRLRSDAALAERFAAGDEAAFAVLYERHRSSVLAVCIGVLGSPHDAEDATQEVFASLAVALRGARPRQLRPWLVRVARNAAIDVRRRRRSGSAGTEVAAPASVSDSGVRAELESVLTAVRELPESQRTALLMRELAGHSYDEIGALLGCEQEAVRGLIARARIGVRNHREASELPCATARQALAEEPDGRRQDKVVRRHVRRCPSCQAYRRALRADAKALHGLTPGPAGGLAGGGALIGAAAKGVLAGGALTQAGTACAVSICSMGGMVLVAPHLIPHPRMAVRPAHGRVARVARRHPSTAARAAGGVAAGTVTTPSARVRFTPLHPASTRRAATARSAHGPRALAGSRLMSGRWTLRRDLGASGMRHRHVDGRGSGPARWTGSTGSRGADGAAAGRRSGDGVGGGRAGDRGGSRPVGAGGSSSMGPGSGAETAGGRGAGVRVGGGGGSGAGADTSGVAGGGSGARADRSGFRGAGSGGTTMGGRHPEMVGPRPDMVGRRPELVGRRMPGGGSRAGSGYPRSRGTASTVSVSSGTAAGTPVSGSGRTAGSSSSSDSWSGSAGSGY